MWVDAPITRTVTMHGLQIPPPAPAPPAALPPPPPKGVPTGWLVAAGAGVLILALFLLFRGRNPNDEALGLYTEARTQCEAGAFEACSAILERAAPLARDPTTQRLIEELAMEARLAPQTEAGTAAVEAGRLDEAERALAAARALAPDNPRVTKLAARLVAARAAEVPSRPEPVAVVPASSPPSPSTDAPAEASAEPVAERAVTASETPEQRAARAARYAARRASAASASPPNVASVAPPVVAAAAPPTVAATEAPRPRAAISLLNPGAAPPVAAPASPRPAIAALPVDGPAPAARPADAPAASDMGFLSVTSAVGGTVYVDGVSTGKRTPLWMFKLSPGEHAVEVRDEDGHVLGRRTVRIEARGVAPVAFPAPK
jgi:hypothetical protein